MLRQSLLAASLALLLVLSGSVAVAQEDVPGTEARSNRKREKSDIGGVTELRGCKQAKVWKGGKQRRTLHLPPISALFFSFLLTISRAIINKNNHKQKTDCNVHPLDTEATAAARIARCAQLAPAALTVYDKASPVIEPPELMAKRKANNAAAAAAAAALAGAGMGGGGASGGAVPGPAA